MAAYAALVSVMHIIHDIQHHPSPPISIHFQQLHSLSQILTSLQEFLESYKSPVADADEADPLEMRIADAAYAVEDVIESYIVDNIHLTASAATPRKSENVDYKQTKSINFYQDLQRVIEEMDLIKNAAMQIDTEKAVAVYDHNVSSSVAPSRSFSSSTAMVCSYAVLYGIMEKLIEDRPDRQVIPIVGMGGIGKTTLAKNVYEHQLIKDHFDVCAWATISQQYNMTEVICDVLSHATNKKKEELSEMSEHKLGSELYQYLFGRRFLIVMDDLWDIDAWENIQHFFPNNGNGSRILVTTRQSQLGSQLNTNYNHQMESLDEDSSWDLFSQTVFGERNSCPRELEKIGKKIVNNCRGLPLSIVVVGGILKRMEQTLGCWEFIRDNISLSIPPFRSSSSSAMVCSEAVLHGIMEKLIGGRLEHQVIPIMGMGFNCFRAPRKPDNVDDEQTKSIKFYQDLQRVIDLIKQVAMQIDTEKAVAVYDHNVSSSVPPFRSSSSSAMVCSDAVLLGIMEKLTGGVLDCQVIPIVGMGGIGKTTLAKTIYEHQLIKEHFDVCAWATISQQYNMREVICEVLSQATNKEKEELSEWSEWSEDKLGSELYKYLSGRRFLIVMDDMWGIDAWENIQHFFPNNGNGSGILVTTRQSQLGSQLNTNYRLQMEFLDEVSSWDLFCKTVFGERNSCPHELEKIGKNIVDSCRGLPLSIVVVGGILKRMKHTQRCWESIRNNLTSIVTSDNDKHCLRLLKLSYNHLPVYLKPCFLYMGVFDEDYEIGVSTLINLWVSEGFLKPMNDRSMETIAMDILKDLVDRNLILIHRLGSTGNIKSCRIHNLLRDLCLNEGERDGFYHEIGRYSPQGLTRQCRRVVIPGNTSKKKVLKELKSTPHVRSVICKYGKVPRCQNFGLLRTLHAFSFESSKVSSLSTQYVNLRHLAIKVRSMSSFISSLHLFWNLHTLIVSCPSYYKCTVPTEIWKMPQFRRIEFTGGVWCLPDPPSDTDDDVVIMENLQIMKGAKNFKCCEEVVKRIPNIKKLEIYYDGQFKGTDHDDFYCVSNIKSLCKLESLSVSCYDPKYKDAPYLHKLSFPHSLKSLTLELQWEAVVEKIGSLPHLEKLKLRGGWFRTGEWEIVEGQFPELKYLNLYECHGLKQWTVEGSSVLPRLEWLVIAGAKQLVEIPSEIGHIPTLQKVELKWCSESVVKSAKEMVEEQVELQGEPLPFHVSVYLNMSDNNEELMGLVDHNFTVINIFR